MARAAAEPSPRETIYVVKMRPALADRIIGQAVARIPFTWPADGGEAYPMAKLGMWLLLREFNGVHTGRSDIARIVAIDPDGLAGYVDRRMCWHKLHFDDEDLQAAQEMGHDLRSIDGVILDLPESLSFPSAFATEYRS